MSVFADSLLPWLALCGLFALVFGLFFNDQIWGAFNNAISLRSVLKCSSKMICTFARHPGNPTRLKSLYTKFLA